MYDANKIGAWIVDNLLEVSEVIGIDLCGYHEDGGETCWGQDGHMWKKGNSLSPTICHPRADEVFGVDEEVADNMFLINATCPTCGPAFLEPHPNKPNVIRCSNCKEHLLRVERIRTE